MYKIDGKQKESGITPVLESRTMKMVSPLPASSFHSNHQLLISPVDQFQHSKDKFVNLVDTTSMLKLSPVALSSHANRRTVGGKLASIRKLAHDALKNQISWRTCRDIIKRESSVSRIESEEKQNQANNTAESSELLQNSHDNLSRTQAIANDEVKSNSKNDSKTKRSRNHNNVIQETTLSYEQSNTMNKSTPYQDKIQNKKIGPTKERRRNMIEASPIEFRIHSYPTAEVNEKSSNDGAILNSTQMDVVKPYFAKERIFPSESIDAKNDHDNESSQNELTVFNTGAMQPFYSLKQNSICLSKDKTIQINNNNIEVRRESNSIQNIELSSSLHPSIGNLRRKNMVMIPTPYVSRKSSQSSSDPENNHPTNQINVSFHKTDRSTSETRLSLSTRPTLRRSTINDSVSKFNILDLLDA